MFSAKLQVAGLLVPEWYTFGSPAELVRFLKWVHRSASRKTRRSAAPIEAVLAIVEVTR